MSSRREVVGVGWAFVGDGMGWRRVYPGALLLFVRNSVFIFYTDFTRTLSPDPSPNLFTHALDILTFFYSPPVFLDLSRISRFVERFHPFIRLALRYFAPVSHSLGTFSVSVRSEVDEQRSRTSQRRFLWFRWIRRKAVEPSLGHACNGRRKVWPLGNLFHGTLLAVL